MLHLRQQALCDSILIHSQPKERAKPRRPADWDVPLPPHKQPASFHQIWKDRGARCEESNPTHPINQQLNREQSKLQPHRRTEHGLCPLARRGCSGAAILQYRLLQGSSTRLKQPEHPDTTVLVSLVLLPSYESYSTSESAAGCPSTAIWCHLQLHSAC